LKYSGLCRPAGQLRSAARACVRLWRAVRLLPAGL